MHAAGENGDLSKVSAKDWADLLSANVQLSQSNEGWNGHVLIHIDAGMQYRILNDENDAKTCGLNQQNLLAIVNITMSKMREAGSEIARQFSDKIEEIGNFMASGGKLQESQGAVGITSQVSRGVFEKGLPTSPPSQEARLNDLPNWTQHHTPLVRQVSVSELGDISQAEQSFTQGLASKGRLESLKACLDADPAVTRSRDGRSGVFFMRALGKEKIVFKFCQQTESHILADRVFSGFFEVPHYQEVSSGTEEASHATDLLRSKGGDYLEKQLRGNGEAGAGRDIGVLESRIKQLDWLCEQKLVIAEFMQATAFSDLELFEREACLSDARFLHQIGEMFLVDTVINNRDRLTETQCNLANFMVKYSDENTMDLISIDHDYDLTVDNQAQVLESLKRLLNKDKSGIEARVDTLIKYGHISIEVNRATIINTIHQGVLSGAEKLLDQFLVNDTYRQAVMIRAGDRYMSPDLEALGEVLKQLKKLIND